MIDEESERLVEITDQILATAELDQGRLAFSETECDIADICRGVVRSASNRHAGKWRFVFSAPTSLAPARRADLAAAPPLEGVLVQPGKRHQQPRSRRGH